MTNPISNNGGSYHTESRGDTLSPSKIVNTIFSGKSMKVKLSSMQEEVKKEVANIIANKLYEHNQSTLDQSLNNHSVVVQFGLWTLIEQYYRNLQRRNNDDNEDDPDYKTGVLA